MSVYFVQEEKPLGKVKIGCSIKPETRVTDLQVGSSSELSLLLVLDGTYDDEVWYHTLFSPYHHRGEWFNYRGLLRLFTEHPYHLSSDVRRLPANEARKALVSNYVFFEEPKCRFFPPYRCGYQRQCPLSLVAAVESSDYKRRSFPDMFKAFLSYGLLYTH